MAESRSLTLADPPATERLGAALARLLAARAPGLLVVYLSGPLGAGKTLLVRGLLAGLGHSGRVPSPTYTLMEPYSPGGYPVLHMDLYRIGDPAEVEYLGLDDVLGTGTLVLVEWPEKGGAHLPPPDLEIELTIDGGGRRARMTGRTAAGDAVLARLRDVTDPDLESRP